MQCRTAAHASNGRQGTTNTRAWTHVAGLAALLVIAAACGSSGNGDGQTQDQAGEIPPEDVPQLAEAPTPELDVSAGHAETAAGTIDAARSSWGTTYVAQLTDDLYVGVALENGTDTSERQDAFVYACDGEGALVASGEISSESTTVESDVMAADLTLESEVVSGAVRIGEHEPLSFTATRATGDAGLYGAEFTVDSIDYFPLWVVLPDGSQRGETCYSCGGQLCCDSGVADTAPPDADWYYVDQGNFWLNLFFSIQEK